MLIDQSRLSGKPLAGQVAVVTGSGRGIGRETARVLARLGARVVVAEIDEDGPSTVESIAAEGGVASFVRTDVGDHASMAELAGLTRTIYGDPDIVVLNAATFVVRPLLEQDRAEFDRQLAVNLGSAHEAIRLFVPAMLERRRGVIVFLGSAEGMPYVAPYSATKTALRSLSASLAAELGGESGVSAYLFNPGMVDTPGGNLAFEAIARRNNLNLDQFIAMAAPNGRLTPADVSATGLAGSVLDAPRYHGVEVDYVTGLAFLGLDADGQPRTEQETSTVVVTAPDSSALAECQAVIALLETMDTEIRGASMFARPMLRRGFRQATGKSLEEFIAQAQSATRSLEAGSFSADAARAYVEDLRLLSALIEQQNGMLRNWERDPAKLELGLAALAERRATVDGAAQALTVLLPDQGVHAKEPLATTV